MTEQPSDTPRTTPDAPATPPEEREHVRTQGETSVDDAFGAADDPS